MFPSYLYRARLLECTEEIRSQPVFAHRLRRTTTQSSAYNSFSLKEGVSKCTDFELLYLNSSSKKRRVVAFELLLLLPRPYRNLYTVFGER
jgi:hypothetical protein